MNCLKVLNGLLMFIIKLEKNLKEKGQGNGKSQNQNPFYQL
ncbi:hypothetical protein ZORO111903_00045 [Zobellia roscoffensis]